MQAKKIAPHVVGETTITGRNQVNLPAKGIKELGWRRGDRLLVEVFGEDMLVLVRRPLEWGDEHAGRLTHVFGTHEDTLKWLEEERRGWDADDVENVDDGNRLR